MDLQDPQVRALIQMAAREASEVTVRNTLVGLGFDMDEPLELQRDMAYLRQVRESTSQIARRGVLIVIGVMVAAALGALWVGVRTALHGP